MRIFIGGSRRVTNLGSEVRRKLDAIMHGGHSVLIGDANGADKSVQRYLHANAYRHVQVFCVKGTCRNNLGGWPVRSVVPPHRRKDFGYYAAKDEEMTDKAARGFMLWDGRSLGTLANVFRLLKQAKRSLVYEAPRKQFINVENEADWRQLLSRCAPEVRRRFQERICSDAEKLHTPSQLALF